jgi:hypothetical protein
MHDVALLAAPSKQGTAMGRRERTWQAVCCQQADVCHTCPYLITPGCQAINKNHQQYQQQYHQQCRPTWNRPLTPEARPDRKKRGPLCLALSTKPAAGEARKDQTPSPRWWNRRTGSPNTLALPTTLYSSGSRARV